MPRKQMVFCPKCRVKNGMDKLEESQVKTKNEKTKRLIKGVCEKCKSTVFKINK
jgi:hypothetical protein